MAAEVRAAGRYDKVIMSIDQVIHLLHKKEAAGVEHSDGGQNGEKKYNDLMVTALTRQGRQLPKRRNT